MDFKVKTGKHGIPKKVSFGAKGFGVEAGTRGGSVTVPNLRPLLDPNRNPLLNRDRNPLLPSVPGRLKDHLAPHDDGDHPTLPTPGDPVLWDQPQGMWDVGISLAGMPEDIELVVDASAFTLDLVTALNDAYYRMDTAAMAASLSPFLKRWNLRDEQDTQVGITADGIQLADPDLVLGIVTELIRSFDTLPERPESAFRNPHSDALPTVTRRERRPDGSVGTTIILDENVASSAEPTDASETAEPIQPTSWFRQLVSRIRSLFEN